MKISEMPDVYKDYMNDTYLSDQHKLITVKAALAHTENTNHIKALKSMKQILKRRITLEERKSNRGA